MTNRPTFNEITKDRFELVYEEGAYEVSITLSPAGENRLSSNTWAFDIHLVHKNPDAEPCSSPSECDYEPDQAGFDEHGAFVPCEECISSQWDRQYRGGYCGRSFEEAVQGIKSEIVATLFPKNLRDPTEIKKRDFIRHLVSLI